MNIGFGAVDIKKLVWAAGALIGVLFLTALCLEILLWLFLRAPEADRIRFQQKIPGVKQEVTYTRNRYGFRSISMTTEKKPANTIRIFCIGASTTAEPNQNTDETWSGILEKRLNAFFSSRGIRVEIAAVGAGGDKVWRGCRFCRNDIARFNVDCVLSLWGINDLVWRGGGVHPYEGASERIKNIATEEKLLEHRRKWSIASWVRAYSQIYKWVVHIRRQVIIAWKIKSGTMLDWSSKNLLALREKYSALPYKESLHRDPDPIVEFTEGLRYFLSCLHDQGIMTVVLAQPVLWKQDLSPEEQKVLWLGINSNGAAVRMSGKWLEQEMNRYNRVQEGLAKEYGAEYVALDTFIPKTLAYFFDDCHFTDKGNVAVASALFPILLPVVERIAIKKGLISGDER